MADKYYFYFFIIFSNFILFYFHEKLQRNIIPIDKPNTRKIHSNPVLISGGLFFLINLFFLLLLNLTGQNILDFPNKFIGNSFYLTAITLFCLGFVDDKTNLNANFKLITIILILYLFLNFNDYFLIKSLNFSFVDKSISLGSYSTFFTILCMALFINSFNMFDGINLQSGSYSLIFFVFFILNNYNFIFCILLLLPHILFLIKNYNSKSFLGDNGCYILSFIISIFIIDFYNNNKIYSDQIFLLMMMPGADMLRLFIIRIYNKKNPFSGDRKHLHHILLNHFSEKKVFRILFIINLFIFILVYYNFNSILIFSLSILFFILLISNKFLKRFN